MSLKADGAPTSNGAPGAANAAGNAERAPLAGAPKADFPILGQVVNGNRLVYLDSAASTQKPSSVIGAVEGFYASGYSNVHRGLHRLSQEATEAFEGARARVARFIGAPSANEVVFTSGTTAAINLVAHTFGERRVNAGDEVLVTELEHHSNIVPWQMLCARRGAELRVVPIDDRGDLDLDRMAELIGPRTRLVCVTHTSNAIGTRNPIERIVELAHGKNVPVLVDGAQAVGHGAVDVAHLGCDFFAFSGHKAYGPTGIGVLYGRPELLEEMPPFLGGGEMIHSVSFEGTTYKSPPQRFEAGTPDIAGAIGLGAAIDYLQAGDVEAAAGRETELVQYALEALGRIDRLRVICDPRVRSGIVSFVVDGVHPHDLGTALDLEGIAVRAGHHCAQPLMERLGLPATVRASFGLYNDRSDVDALCAALPRAIQVLG